MIIPLLVMALASGAEGDEPQVWTEVGVEGEVVDDFRLSFEQSLRIAPTSDAPVTDLLSDFGLSWDPLRWLRIGAAYRIGAEDFDGSPRLVQRFAIDLSQRWRAGPVRFSLRERYQVEPSLQDPNHTVRLRARVGVKVERFQPYVQVEPWVRVGEPAPLKVRVEAGLKTELSYFSLRPYYRLEIPLADADDPRLHIVGISASFELARPKRAREREDPP